MSKSLNSAGFSLMDLLVVISLIGILAAIAVPSLNAGNRSLAQTEVPGKIKEELNLA